MTYARMTSVSCICRLPGPLRRFLGGGAALGLAIFLTPYQGQAQNFEDAVAGEVEKGAMALLRVNHYLNQGDDYAAKGEIGRAFSNYREAFETLPRDASGDSFRESATTRYADATVKYAEELIEQNRAREARLIVEELLDPQRVPDDPAATALLERLKDPEWVNPAATPRHQANVDRVTKLLGEANTLIGMGEFDEATNKFSEVLNIDEYNTAAREGLVKASQESRAYRDASYDATRAELLDQLMQKWEYNNPDAVRGPRRSTEDPGLISIEDAPQSADIARRLAAITIPEVNFNGMTIEAAVRYLERLSRDHDPSGVGINFVLSSSQNIDRSRPITMSVKSMPLLVVVQYVTELVGAKFRIDQYAVQIVPEDDDDATMVQRSFLVQPDFFTTGGGSEDDPGDPFGGEENRVRVVSAQDFLEENGVTFPEGATAQYLPLANKLIVSNTLSNLDLIDSLVSTNALDAPKQVVIKVNLLDVRQENLTEIGFDWLVDAFEIDDVLGGGGTIVPPVDTSTTQPGYTSGESDFAFSDPVTGEIFGGHRVTEGLRSGQSVLGANALDRVIGIDRETALSTNLAGGIFSVKGQLTDPQFQAVIRGINQKKASDVVTAPFVTVKPGHRARIDSGIELIYPVEYDPPELPQEVTALQGGVFPVTPAHPTTFQMRQLGFTLEVEPVISPDGQMVSMTLSPEFVEFLGFVNYGSPITAAGTDLLGNPTNIVVTDNQILMPVFSTIRKSLEASIYDGATLVIGGLTEDRRDAVVDKVPILGDLPFVGRLFRNDIDRSRNRAVVVFVTVKIIDAKGARVNRAFASQGEPELGFSTN